MDSRLTLTRNPKLTRVAVVAVEGGGGGVEILTFDIWFAVRVAGYPNNVSAGVAVGADGGADGFPADFNPKSEIERANLPQSVGHK